MSRILRRIRDEISIPQNRLLLLFGLEGMLIQFVMSLGGANSFATNVYATNMGATDSQLGMIPLVSNLAAVTLLLPAGILADRAKNPKTLPVAILLILSVMYIFHGTVPSMGEYRMVFFFITIALTAGLLATYNGVWQAFFGDVTHPQQRNRVFAFRNRMVFIISTIAPVICGALLTATPESDGKLLVLRIFFYISAAICLANAYALSKIPSEPRTPEQLAATVRVTPAAIGGALKTLATNRRFLNYFIPIFLFYIFWHMDWSMWYIGQTRYVGMSEAQLSVYSAFCSVSQLLVMGFFVKLTDRWGVQKMFVPSILSLVICPLGMILMSVLPGNRGLLFTCLIPFIFLPQCVMNLCLVQMLLDAVPEQNRALSISLHSMIVTLSNALMPYLGVQLYTALGANERAFRIFFLLMFVLRGASGVLYWISIRKKEK